MSTVTYAAGRSRLLRWQATLFLLLVVQTLFAQLPTGFINVRVQNGYTAPMGVVFAPGTHQLFVWEKAGRVWVSNWNGTEYIRQTTPVLDISEEVGDWRDLGLMSLCLDPNFSQNGRIYLFYVVDRHHLLYAGTSQYDRTRDEYHNATIGRLTRYRVATTGNGLTADPGSRAVLLGETKTTGVPLTHESHVGGALLFGTDGTLLVSTGDCASFNGADLGSAAGTYWQQAINDGIMRPNENVGAFRAQMLTSLNGKLLRLDPETGDGVASNPFYDGSSPRSARSRVWTFGFRNPFRMAIQVGSGSLNPADANPGTLIVADAGWNVWEEFNIIKRPGENAGWPMFEGMESEYSYMQAAQTLQNKDEPNPTNTCNKPFLTFANLLKQAQNESIGTVTALNPCTQQPLPGLQRRYFHSRPALDWKHGTENIARYPSFNGNTATTTTLGSNGATVLGQTFGGNTSIAGAWYEGTRFPSEYQNAYFFADYGTNWIRVAKLGANGLTEIKKFAPDWFCQGIVDMEYNELDQSLYFVNINSSEIMRISYGGNQPPVAAIIADKLTGSAPLTVSFQGDQSSDPDGNTITYRWDFDDGTTSTLANPTHTFNATGQQGFTVRLTVTDSHGLTDQEQVTVSLGNVAPTVHITNPVNGSQYSMDGASQYTLKATVNDDNPAGMTYSWQVILRHNNHEHRESVLTQAQPTVNISPVGCDGETYYYLIHLTVTDQGRLTATDSVKIFPNCATANLAVTNLITRPQNQSAVVSWKNPLIAFDEVMVVAREGSGFTDKPSGTNYVANNDFGGPGSTLEGGKVVYKGADTTVTVRGLANGTRYYFRVYTRKGTDWTGGVETSAIPRVAVAAINLSACYRLTARVSGKALEIGGGSMADLAPAQQRTYADKAWQQWKFEVADGNYYQLIAQHTNKALDVSRFSQDDLAEVVQWHVSNGTNQHWLLEANSQGYYSLTARHSGKALEVSGGSLDEGAAIVQSSSTGSFNQQWLIEPVGCVSNTPSPPALTIDPAACYRLTARVSGKVLEIGGGSRADLAPAQQRTYADKAWQQWKFAATDAGYYRLIAQHTNKAIDVYAASLDNAVPLVQWAADGGLNQHWLIQSSGPGYYSLTARHSGKALEVSGGSLDEGAAIVQFAPSGSANQQWSIEAVGCVANVPNPVALTIDPAACYRLTARVSGKVLEIGGGSRADLAPAQQRTYADKAWQQWKFAATDAGYYRLIAQHTNKAIDVYAASLDNAVPLVQWAADGGLNQHWLIQSSGPGYYSLTARHSGKALEVSGGSLDEGAAIVQFAPNGSASQQWSIEAVGCTANVPNPVALAIDPAACYRLTARVSGKALEIGGGSRADLAPAQQRTYADKAWQQWKFAATDAGYYRLIAQHTNKAIDVYAASLDNAVPLVQWAADGGLNQHWLIQSSGPGYYSLTARHSGKALEVSGGSLDEGAAIVQFAPSGSANQQWSIEAVGCVANVPNPVALTIDPAACYRLTARVSGKALAVGDGLMIDQAPIEQHSYTDKAWQQWKFQVADGNYYRLVAQHSGKVLDVNGASVNDLAMAIQWPANGGSNQHWLVQSSGPGYYSLTARHSGKALEVSEGSLDEGAAIVQFAPSGSASQQWSIETVGCTANARLASENLSKTGVTAATTETGEDSHPSFAIFPNPARDYVNITVSGAVALPMELTVSDALGRIVDRSTAGLAEGPPYRLRVSHLSAGLYWMMIKPEGTKPVVRRLVIVR